MYYVPVKVIPGRLAQTDLANARSYAKMIKSCVEDEEGNIIEDYRGA